MNKNQSAENNQNVFKLPKKWLILAASVVAIITLAGVFIHNVQVKNEIAYIENLVCNFSENVSECEETIAEAYSRYSGLSKSNQSKVTNREELLGACKQLESLIEARKEAAAEVDEMIGQIDETDLYKKANTVRRAAIAYSRLDEKTKLYLKFLDNLSEKHEEVKDFAVDVTSENFHDFFVVECFTGEEQNGYDINKDSITPHYDEAVHNDYATPIYVYVQCKYPYLISECSFHINLHQTYNGFGIIDSDIHEFELQEDDIFYSTEDKIGEYVIYVENPFDSLRNTLVSGRIDTKHEMNPFDESRVRISNIEGNVRY